MSIDLEAEFLTSSYKLQGGLSEEGLTLAFCSIERLPWSKGISEFRLDSLLWNDPFSMSLINISPILVPLHFFSYFLNEFLVIGWNCFKILNEMLDLQIKHYGLALYFSTLTSLLTFRVYYKESLSWALMVRHYLEVVIQSSLQLSLILLMPTIQMHLLAQWVIRSRA